MPRKLLVVFGATGNQGGSIINFVMNDPFLCNQYQIRAVTRDVNKPKAIELRMRGFEVCYGDYDNYSSLLYVLQGVDTVFIVTLPIYDEHMYEREVRQGKAAANAANAQSANLIIFSTLPNARVVSGGGLDFTEPFDTKADIEDYIRTLPSVNKAFFIPGFYMQNFRSHMGPKRIADGSYVLNGCVSPQTQLPLIDITETGKFIGAILHRPGNFAQASPPLCAATRLYSYTEIAAIMTRVTGRTVRYRQLPSQVWTQTVGADRIKGHALATFLWIELFGYFGADTAGQMVYARNNARGELTEFEDWLRNNPLQLQ
ncbi:uncharacterized protein KY384_001278 [Bacidia gigantensis]|uniref:uncharacterized protein n=1 Tax=Bacidia gigantensis TaxID=2732470 RepID=UPI001D04F629|nr:uncharacterized protein KY384_001278 [Bacidia gigantensis]KAG8533538.1 hypothetical protein KY384_001278 [Bacidia gigantensis]